MRNFRRTTAIALGVYLTAIALLWIFQRELIYAPDDADYVPPSHYSMLDGVQEIALETADGFELTAWFLPAPARRPTVVVFPGKSSSLRNQRYRIRHFKDARMGVLLVAWRGYSGNPGSPDEQGLYTDARAALDWLELHRIESSSIVLYGASLGSGVATQLAVERPVGAVVLEAPYTSIVDVAARRYPVVPVRWLLRDRFDSRSRIDRIDVPLLIMHGDADKVVPQRFGRQLFEKAKTRKEGFWPTDVGHNDLFDRGGFDAARNFIERTIDRLDPMLSFPTGAGPAADNHPDSAAQSLSDVPAEISL